MKQNCTMRTNFNNLFVRRQTIRSFYILLFCVFSFSVSAVEPNYQPTKKDTAEFKWETFSVSFGGFITNLSNDVVVGSEQLGLGVLVNMEDAFGFESNILVFRSDIDYNFGKRGRSNVNLGYFGFLRNAAKVLESEITIGDNVFPIGTNVQSKYNLQIIKAAYKYNYFLDKRVKLGASVGFFVMPITFSTNALTSETTTTDFVAPLPVIGLDATFAVTPKIYIKQSIEVLYLKIGGLEGNINDINIRAEYNPWKHFGFGLGYNYFQMGVSSESSTKNVINFSGEIKSKYAGLMFYARYFF